MHKKLKIAIYSGQIPSTTFIESLIKAVAEHHEVRLFGTQIKAINYPNKNIKTFKNPNNKWLRLSYNIWRSLLLGLHRPKDLISLCREVTTYNTAYEKWQNYSKLLPIILYKPDILHIQWAKNLADLMVLKTEFNIPIVLSLRGAHINYSPIVSKKLAASYCKNFPQVDAFHAVSKAIGCQAEKYRASVEKILVIYSMVPPIFLEAYKSLKPKTDNIIKILSVGRSHWKKGYPYAIQAISILKNKGYTVQYQIIGIDKPDEELLFLIAELGLYHEVILRKSMAQSELIRLMQTQDALLLSSIEEGIANVVLEAMAVGLPVISTDCGGMKEVVIPKETGFLVPVRDSEAFAKAVIELQNLPFKQLEVQTKNAHNLIKSKFDQMENVKQFLALYQL